MTCACDCVLGPPWQLMLEQVLFAASNEAAPDLEL
jgi:hypothetical protein